VTSKRNWLVLSSGNASLVASGMIQPGSRSYLRGLFGKCDYAMAETRWGYVRFCLPSTRYDGTGPGFIRLGLCTRFLWL
jgi:hypothetical protein